MVKNPPANAGDVRDTGLIPELRRSPGVGNGDLLQYSGLENSMDNGAWQATAHGIVKSWTLLNTERDASEFKILLSKLPLCSENFELISLYRNYLVTIS